MTDEKKEKKEEKHYAISRCISYLKTSVPMRNLWPLSLTSLFSRSGLCQFHDDWIEVESINLRII